MQKVFLKAQWKNLIMVNYACDENILLPYLPAKTELDTFQGTCYISLVGFLFLDTRVQGVSIPFHKNFEEINLRFYVKYNDGDIWKRGVVFIKEIVPKYMITNIANAFYNEKYETLKTLHTFSKADNMLHVSYKWKYRKSWSEISVITEADTQSILPESEEEFITEHFWGYTIQKNSRTMEYAVEHPRWQIYPVKNFTILCDFAQLYGKGFAFLSSAKPLSVLLSEGSEVLVRKGILI